MTPPRRASRAHLRVLLRSSAAGLLALVLAGPALPLAAPAAAKETAESSSSSYLCTGYAGCQAAGYGHAGYAQRGGTMYWNMYSGHNCTNYVAYRMVQAGMPNVRPWSGSGNAMYWGTSNASKTDRTPEVGAVAWWRANRPGVSGSAGHVAYVERVVSPSEIIVSEDSWGGDFHWRRYSVAAGTWPDGFVHFIDTTPALTSKTRPRVSGTAKVGEPLTSGRGTWSKRVDGVTRQWLADGDPVRGATGKRFVPRPRDYGKELALRVTARKEGHEPGTAVSAATDPVKRGRFATTRPTVTGTPEVGEVLEAAPGTFRPEVGRTAVQWYADGKAIAGATGDRLVLEQRHAGARVQVGVDGFGRGYVPARTRSLPTEPVAKPSLQVEEPPTIDGTPRLGETLTVDPGAAGPRATDVRFRWLRDGERVRGAREASYPVGPRDVGGWLSVEVVHVREGYQRSTQLVEVPQPVRSVPQVEVGAVGGERRAVVRVALTAPGVEEPGGQVRVSVGRREVEVPLEGGAARALLSPLPAGERTVRVSYLGSELVLPADEVVLPVTVERGPRPGGARAQ